MHASVGVAIVGLLIHDESVGPALDPLRVHGRPLRLDLHGETRHVIRKSRENLAEVTARHVAWMLSRNHEQMSKPPIREELRFRDGLLHGERLPTDRILA